MNERIKELAVRSGATWLDGNPHGVNHYYVTSEQQMAKFAELIVRECMSLCDDYNSQKYIANRFGLTPHKLSEM